MSDLNRADVSPIWHMFMLFILASAMVAIGCAKPIIKSTAEPKPKSMLKTTTIQSAIDTLVALHGAQHRANIERRVSQAAALWTSEDGTAEEFIAFCTDHFLTKEAQRSALLARLEDNLEQIFGHLLEIGRHLRMPTDLDIGPVLPVDPLFAQYDLSAHAIEDLFKTKIAFAVLLNFDLKNLEELDAVGESLTRDQWVQARAAQLFASRVPSSLSQKITSAFVEADDYINNYNIHMGHLLTETGERLFPDGLVLISHWGLRDELKSHYSEADGLPKQRLIQTVMEKIVRQEIPANVIDNPNVDWVVSTGELRPAPGASQERLDASAEANIRYEKLLSIFQAVKAADPYHPSAPNYIQRNFEEGREMSQTRVVGLLESVLLSEVVDQVATLIRERLGRPLEPFDIWYDGFSSRAGSSEQSLDEEVRRRYPTVSAFEKDIPRILQVLGFDRENALDIGGRIAVDPARGAGHALGADRRGDKAHLRTRIPSGGMNYKGFNIAMHELGHNVEQVLSLDRIDHWLLRGVPNTAFTEGFAFSFQGKDMEVLGRNPSKDAQFLSLLDTFWSLFEIAGVSMVDIGIWEWLYAHPDATPAQTKQAMIEIAANVWNKYYTRIFGKKDVVLLAIYSHIIDAGLYTPDYPLGFLIQFQMEAHFEKNGHGREIERMCRLGALTPDVWMKQAVGQEVSAEPLLEAVRKALSALSSNHYCPKQPCG